MVEKRQLLGFAENNMLVTPLHFYKNQIGMRKQKHLAVLFILFFWAVHLSAQPLLVSFPLTEDTAPAINAAGAVEGSLLVLNYQGQVVYQKALGKLAFSEGGLKLTDVMNWPKGGYLLVIEAGRSVRSVHLLKQ